MPIRTTLFALAASLLFVGSSFAQSRTTSGTAALDSEGTVRVENHEGQITIETWDRAEVRYEAVVQPESGAEFPDATVVRVQEDSRRFEIRTHYDESKAEDSGFWGGSNQNVMPVEYTLTVPRTAHVEIEDHESDIQVAGLEADVQVDTHDGAVTIRKQVGAAEIDSHDGPITVEEHSGALTIDTHDSRVRLRSVEGETEMDAHDVEVEADGLRGGLQLDAHDGDGRFGFAEVTGDVEIDTHDGGFMLVLPSGTGFDLHTDFSDDADLRADIDLAPYRISAGDDEDEVNYSGQVNGGGPRIELRSHDGSFEIRTQ